MESVKNFAGRIDQDKTENFYGFDFILRGLEKSCRKKRELTPLYLPYSYFNEFSDNRESCRYSLKIETEDFRNIKKIACYKNIKISDILLSLTAYLLSEVCRKRRFTFQTAIEGRIVPLDIDLFKIKTFNQLIIMILLKKKSGLFNSYTIERITRNEYINKQNAVMPLFYTREPEMNVKGYKDIFGLSFEAGISRNNIKIILESEKRIRRDKNIKLLNLYYKAVKMLKLFWL